MARTKFNDVVGVKRKESTGINKTQLPISKKPKRPATCGVRGYGKKKEEVFDFSEGETSEDEDNNGVDGSSSSNTTRVVDPSIGSDSDTNTPTTQIPKSFATVKVLKSKKVPKSDVKKVARKQSVDKTSIKRTSIKKTSMKKAKTTTTTIPHWSDSDMEVSVEVPEISNGFKACGPLFIQFQKELHALTELSAKGIVVEFTEITKSVDKMVEKVTRSKIASDKKQLKLDNAIKMAKAALFSLVDIVAVQQKEDEMSKKGSGHNIGMSVPSEDEEGDDVEGDDGITKPTISTEVETLTKEHVSPECEDIVEAIVEVDASIDVDACVSVEAPSKTDASFEPEAPIEEETPADTPTSTATEIYIEASTEAEASI